MNNKSSMEEFIFEFIDQCKLLFFPEQWKYSFMDFSKNEIFALLFVYRKGNANMTEIADYLGIPLNTATGIIGRLEKRGVIKRERDLIDKRVVTIAISSEGMELLTNELKTISNYYLRFMESITEEEKLLLIKIIGKFLDIISQDISDKINSQEKSKKVRKIEIE